MGFNYVNKPSASPNAGKISGGHHHSGANVFLYGLQQQQYLAFCRLNDNRIVLG